MQTILLVEDDPEITRTLAEFLHSEGFAVTVADGQRAALDCFAHGRFDLVLLDISLRDGNGYAVCGELKKRKNPPPILFLTASGDESSIVTGFDLGADDYIPKPFKPRELISRIKNALRRSGNRNLLEVEDLVIDAERGTVTKNGSEILLSALEYRLLLLLVSNRGRLMTREKLLEDIWDVAGDFVNDNTLTVYIKRIREKVEDDPSEPQIIRTVRGLGYRVD